MANVRRTFEIGSSASLDRNAGQGDLNGLAYGKLSYQNMIGTEASLDFSPLGLGQNRGAIGLTLKHPLRKGAGFQSDKGLALLNAQSDVSVQG